jgi:hypothetical protein
VQLDHGRHGHRPGRQQPAAAKITAVPAANAKDVPVSEPVRITVADGTLSQVTLTNPEGKEVPGKLAEDKLSWTSTEPLGTARTTPTPPRPPTPTRAPPN